MNNTKEILDDLRNITMLTGELASVHEESLRNWPYVLFDDIKGVEIKYDLTKEYTKETGEGYVDYYIDFVTDEVAKRPLEENDKKLDILTSWVRDMFWKEIKVIVYFNSEKFYENSSKDEDGLSKDRK